MRIIQLFLFCWALSLSAFAANVQILAKPAHGANETAVQAAFSGQGATQVTNISQINVRVLSLPAAASTNAINALLVNPLFEFAERDELVPELFTPNDPSYPSQWAPPIIQCPSAWNISRGSSSVIIAICDSGIESTHPDLAANIVSGWNFYDNNNNTSDIDGHGTGVAGVAAAVGNNSIGLAGIAMNCKLMPLRITDTNGFALFSMMASAITYAADHSARVANLSYKASTSLTVQNAGQYLDSKGGVLVVSAGNDGLVYTNADSLYMLNVSGTTTNDTLWPFSSTGNNVDLAAPADQITTTTSGGLYGFGTGTSFSAPIVAGVAALIISINPNLTGQQIQTALKNSADDLGTVGWDANYGWGRVNAFKALTLVGGYTGTISVTATPGCNWSVSVDVPWITIVNGASGTGNGTVTYLVANNPTSTARTGRITAAGKLCIVTQTGIPCTFSVSPSTVLLTSAGGSGSIALTANDTVCAWTVTSDSPWLTGVPTSGSGNGSITYSAAASSFGTTRIGKLTIAGQIFTVTQTGDTTVPVVTLTAPANGSTISNVVTLSATATDNSSVSRVEFYRDSATLIGTVVSSPYTLPFQTTNIVNGSHPFYARAFDPANNQGFSTTNTVTVNNAVTSNTNTWAQRFGSTGGDQGRAVAIDLSTGDIVMAGIFNGTVNFGGTNMTATSASDIVLAKYSSAGVHQWSEKLSGTGNGTANSVAIDSSGNIFLAGSFANSVDFGGGALVSAGGQDMFLAKYSTLGAFAWAHRFGSTSDDIAYGTVIDPGGNVLLTGTFRGNVSFGGSALISAGTFQSPYIPGTPDVFIAKFSTLGVHTWSENFTNNTAADEGNGIAVDSASNVYIAGYYSGTIDFGGGILPQFGASDIYLAKFNSSGAYQWANHYGGTGTDRGQALAVDSSGNVFLAGIFTGLSNFGGTSITAAAGYDVFLAKYSTGGTLSWVKGFGGANGALPNTVTVDSGNNVLVGGYFQSPLNVGGTILSTAGGQDSFAGKFSNTGTLAWAQSFGGPLTDFVSSLTTDSNNYVVGAGAFSGTANFGGTSLISAGSYDIFLLRLVP